MHYSLLLVVLVVVGGAYGVKQRDDDCCSVEDKHEIQWIWQRVWQSSHTERKIRIMSAVVADIFEHHPEFKDAMKERGVEDVKSPAARAYMIRLTHQFDNIINLLDDPMVLLAQLDFLKGQYQQKGVKKTYFEAIAESFERVLPQVSSCFPTAAWNRCLERLSHAISEDVHD